MRKYNDQLNIAATQFLIKQQGTLFFNLTFKTYFKNQKRAKKHMALMHKDDERYSKYDRLVKNFAPS